jgi:hypothetical protein
MAGGKPRRRKGLAAAANRRTRAIARILCGPGQAVFPFLPRRPESTAGARDAVGSGCTHVYAVCANRVLGPTGLDASRHRGVSKLIVPQVRQSLGVPRAVFVRFAPQRPRWSDRFRPPPRRLGGLTTALDPNDCRALPTVPATVAGGAPRRAAGAPGRCGLDRRAASPHLQRSVIPRPPLPAPPRPPPSPAARRAASSSSRSRRRRKRQRSRR